MEEVQTDSIDDDVGSHSVVVVLPSVVSGRCRTERGACGSVGLACEGWKRRQRPGWVKIDDGRRSSTVAVVLGASLA